MLPLNSISHLKNADGFTQYRIYIYAGAHCSFPTYLCREHMGRLPGDLVPLYVSQSSFPLRIVMKIKRKRGRKQFGIPGTFEERMSTKITVKITPLQKIVHKWGLITHTYVLRGIRPWYISDKSPFLGNFA